MRVKLIVKSQSSLRHLIRFSIITETKSSTDRRTWLSWNINYIYKLYASWLGHYWYNPLPNMNFMLLFYWIHTELHIDTRLIIICNKRPYKKMSKISKDLFLKTDQEHILSETYCKVFSLLLPPDLSFQWRCRSAIYREKQTYCRQIHCCTKVLSFISAYFSFKEPYFLLF